MRKTIELIGGLFESHNITGWRQYRYNIKKIKQAYRAAQQSKRSKASNADQAVKEMHEYYIKLAESFLYQVVLSLNLLTEECALTTTDILRIEEINRYIDHAKRQINQIDHRVLRGEKIPNNEKVFSLFEPHTEWIMKGKAGVPFELGIKVGIVEDQYQFILHHQVMQKITDEQVAVDMVEKTKEKFPEINSISYDRGYFSKDNRELLGKLLAKVSLPKRGKLSEKDKEIQNSESYKQAQHKHSAVESAINALDIHGLDQCPDHEITGFERYVAVAIVARNIQRIGAIIHQRDQKLHIKREHRRRLKQAA